MGPLEAAEGVADAAPEYGAAKGGLSAPEVHLLQSLIFLLLISDVGADGFFVAPDRVDAESPGPEMLPHEIALRSPYTRAMWIALLPLMKPTTCDTAYFGGIDSSICT